MKKVLAIAVLGVFVLGSCKKDRTCECTDSTGEKDSITWSKTKKKDAQEACDALSALAAIGGGSCSLK